MQSYKFNYSLLSEYCILIYSLIYDKINHALNDPREYFEPATHSKVFKKNQIHKMYVLFLYVIIT